MHRLSGLKWARPLWPALGGEPPEELRRWRCRRWWPPVNVVVEVALGAWLALVWFVVVLLAVVVVATIKLSSWAPLEVELQAVCSVLLAPDEPLGPWPKWPEGLLVWLRASIVVCRPAN